ncbi:MAG: type II toxin-antitoxin system VapC family toxin [Acidobacteria bacterium]|nr:type II toxin-antitoxin system VapC family toxin [Acidobacteriota bacterium]
MRRVVVDTSVLAAITFGESMAQEWSVRLDGATLYAPTLLQYEMANVARKKCRQRPERTREILTALELTLDPRKGIVWMDPNPMDVVVLANATGLSPYDASYMWLAGFLGADLVTRDRALAAAVDPFTGVELVE